MESSLADEVTMFRKKVIHMGRESFCLYAEITLAELRAIERGFKPTQRVYEQLSWLMGLSVEALQELEVVYQRKIGHQARKLH